MQIIVRDGKHYLRGGQEEVARVLLRTAKRKSQPIDFGWTLNRMADEASVVEGRRYACSDCQVERQELEFGNGTCPSCGSKNIARTI